MWVWVQLISPLRWAIRGTADRITTWFVGEAKTAMLDLCYEEDSRAEVDFNLVMTGAGEFVEVQGCAEGKPFSRERLSELLEVGEASIRRIFELQREALES